MAGISQSLPGRVAVFSLLPLSIGETVETEKTAQGLDEILNALISGEESISPGMGAIDLAEWILRGGYPEKRTRQDVDRKIWCASYIQTYLERDVRQLLKVGDLNAFNWRDQSGLEVDLIIDRNGRLYPIETKATTTLMPGHFKGLKRWRRLAGDRATSGIVIADVDEPVALDRMRGVPWRRALAF